MTWFASNAGGSSGDARGAVVCNYKVNTSATKVNTKLSTTTTSGNLPIGDISEEYIHDVVVFNNEIYYFYGNTSSPKLYKYNGTSWTLIDTTFPYNIYYSKVVVYNNEFHILGSNYTREDSVKHYKFDGSTWTEVSTLPYQFASGSAAVYKGELHILGTGCNLFSYFPPAEQKYHYKWDGSKWTNVGTLPISVKKAYLYVYSNRLYLLYSVNTLYSFSGTAWSKASTLNTPDNSYNVSAAICLGSSLYVGSKYVSGSTNYSRLYKYSYRYNEWFKIEDYSDRFSEGGRMVSMNDRIYILGGSSASAYNKSLRILNPEVYTYSKTLELYLNKNSEIRGSGKDLFHVDENDSNFEIITTSHFKFLKDGYCKIGLRDSVTADNLSTYPFSIF